MLIVVLVLFVLSIIGLLALFSLKYVEAQRGTQYMPERRVWADEQALKLKDFLGRSHGEFAKVLPAFALILRIGVHELALLFAAFARLMEREAHRIADMVSHKHRFERRESRSEFLKQVGEFKNTGAVDEVVQES